MGQKAVYLIEIDKVIYFYKIELSLLLFFII